MPDDIRALQWAADEARRQSNEYMARAASRAPPENTIRCWLLKWQAQALVNQDPAARRYW